MTLEKDMQIKPQQTKKRLVFISKMMKNTCCFSLLFFMGLHLSFSQEIKLTGIVKDSIGNVLESANVIAFNAKTNKLKSYSVTNANGTYKIALDKKVAYTLKISFIGYKTITNHINETTFKEDTVKNYILYEENNKLDEVVLAYEIPINVKNDTIVYNSASFLNGTEKKLGDILKKIPGIEINSKGQIEIEGKQVMKVMIEGKDFFDGDSKLAAENVPSNAVKKIEVLKNFSEISQLKSVTNNEDNIVINLKLKEGKKNFWFGEITIGDGADKSYLIHPKLFYYSPAKSINILADFNNIGKIPFTFDDYMNFTGGLNKGNKGSGTSFNLSSNSLGLSLLKNNRANKINSKFGAINFSYVPKKTWGLNGFLIFSKTEVDFLEKSTTNYSIDQLTAETDKKTFQNNKMGLGKLSSTYKPDENFQFDYDLFLKVSKQDELGLLNTRFSNIENTIQTTMNSDPYSIKQKANLYYTINPNHIVSSNIQYLIEKENPFYNASFIDLGVNPSNSVLPFSNLFPYNTDQENYTINQHKTIKTSKLDAKLDYYYLINNKNNLIFTLGNTLSRQKFNSSIFQTLDDQSAYNFTDAAFKNKNVAYNFSDVFLGVKYKVNLGKFMFNPGVSLHKYQTKNKQLGNISTVNSTKVLPSFYANLQLQKSESLRFTYKKTAAYASIDKIAEGYILNNYSSLFKGNSSIENGIYEKYRLSYYSFSLFNNTTVFGGINYSKKKNELKNNTMYTQINNIATPVNSLFKDETISMNLDWRKTFKKYNVNFKIHLEKANYHNMINGLQNNSNSLIQEYTASVLTNYKKVPNFELGYKRTSNQYSNSIRETTYLTDKPFVNIEASFLKHFSFKSEFSYYKYATKNNALNTYSFLDASINYQHKNSKWEYKLGLTNILNTSSMNQDSFNQNYTSTSQYFIQPRFAVFSLTYNL
jgi:hypothetical protein